MAGRSKPRGQKNVSERDARRYRYRRGDATGAMEKKRIRTLPPLEPCRWFSHIGYIPEKSSDADLSEPKLRYAARRCRAVLDARPWHRAGRHRRNVARRYDQAIIRRIEAPTGAGRRQQADRLRQRAGRQRPHPGILGTYAGTAGQAGTAARPYPRNQGGGAS